jgi:CheY-like chemotaxis protein
MTIRILIADDSSDHLELLRMTLEQLPGIDTVAIARDGLEAVRQATEQDVDVALLDVDMPNLDGLGAAAAIRRARPRTRVLLQTGYLSDDVCGRADELGIFVFEKLDLVKNLGMLGRLSDERKVA